MESNENFITNNESLHFGHLGAIFSVALLLVGISWFKHPDLFNFNQTSNNVVSANLPRYYAYETPAELNQPLVAGASTAGQGPMIIGEDGNLIPAVDSGDVLGINTENINLNYDSVSVNIIIDSEENRQNYINAVQLIEGANIDSAGFELALSSGDQTKIDNQATILQAIIEELRVLNVPLSYKKFHQLKTIQYEASLEILKNFTQADSNPELINSKLEIFLVAEQAMQEEAYKFSTK